MELFHVDSIFPVFPSSEIKLRESKFKLVQAPLRIIEMSSVKVAVRVRPFNNREKAKECSCIISMSGEKTSKHSEADSVYTYCMLSFVFLLVVCLVSHSAQQANFTWMEKL